MSETWRDVLGYRGRYQVSDLGQVRAMFTYRDPPPRLMKQFLSTRGRPQVYLSLEGRLRTHPVHVLVAEAFHGPRPVGLQVCHSDGDVMNNQAVNLRWGTPKENAQDTLRLGRNPNLRKTHCPQGHPYSIENTYCPPGARNNRMCRICMKQRHRVRRAER